MRKGLVKRLLPSTFLGRSVMIIVMPLILLEVVSTWVFYDRHWDTVTRRLAGAVAGEVSMVIESMRRFPGKENEAQMLSAASTMNIRVAYRRGEILPNVAPEIGRGILDRRLSKALAEQIKRPFHMDTWTYDRQVRIKVQLSDGVLDVFVSRERLFSSTTYIFIMWMVGTSMVLFAIASIFMRNQVRPIRRLAKAADQFGRGVDVEDFKPEGAAEVRMAATSFMSMRDRIGRHLSQRTALLAGVSHDLRTPLTRLRNQLENTLMSVDNDEAREQAGRAVAEADQLLATFNALLRIARLETRGNTADMKPVPLDELVTDACELYEALAEDKDQSFEQGLESGVMIEGDRDLLFQMVSNLIDNAIKYTPEHGVIGVSVRREGADAVFEVRDSGIGIPDAEKDQVFQRFYRVGKSRSLPGNGLGLSLVSAVAEIHQGRIVLSDTHPGEESPGLTVAVKIPAYTEARKRIRAAQAEQPTDSAAGETRTAS